MNIYRIFIFTIICIASSFSVTAQQMNINWMKSAGGMNWDVITDMDVNDSNIVVTGTFNEKIVFDSDTLYSMGNRDIFVARFDTKGNYINSFRLGTPGFDFVHKIVLDNAANLVIALRVNHPLQISPKKIDSLDNFNFIIMKLTPQGDYINHLVYGTSQESVLNDLFIDAKNSDIYFTGTFSGKLITPQNEYIANNEDFFVGKMDKNGTLSSFKLWSGEGNDKSFNIIMDKSNTIYLTGSTHSGCFGQTIEKQNVQKGKDNFFVVAINKENFSAKIAYPFYGTDFMGKGITVTDSAIWITTMFRYDLTYRNRTISSKGKYDILLLHSPLEKFKFSAQQIGGVGSDVPVQIASTGNHLVFSGMYSDTLQLDDQLLIPDGNWNDIFVSTLNPKGKIDRTFTLTGTGYNFSSTIKTYKSGVYVAGEYTQDIGYTNNSLKAKGDEDIFIGRFENCDAKKPLVITIDTLNISQNIKAYNLKASDGFISYLWNNNSNKKNLSNVKDGLYYVEVEDSWGCFYVDSVSLTSNKSVLLNDDSKKDGNIKFYPTYTNDYVNIVANEAIETDYFFIIIADMSGKIIYKQNIKGELPANRIFQLNMKGFAPAHYVVKVKTDKKEFSSKIIVH